jgi:streptogramin lyase
MHSDAADSVSLPDAVVVPDANPFFHYEAGPDMPPDAADASWVDCTPSIDSPPDAGAQDASPPDSSAVPTQLSLLAGQLGGNGNRDGVGSTARFTNLTGVAADQAGHVYVADELSGVRDISVATGRVTTLGTFGLAPTPQFLALSGSTLYVANQDVMAAVDLATDSVSNVIPPSSLQISGIATDVAGVLYVGGDVVFKVQPTTNTWTALTPVQDYPMPGAVAADGTNVYMITGCGILKIGIASGTVGTLAGGTTGWNCMTLDGIGSAAGFADPTALADDDSGDLYVTDKNALRKVVVTTGQVSTVDTSIQLQGPTALAFDGTANLYATDFYAVQQVSTASGSATTLAGLSGNFGNTDGVGAAARFYAPGELATDRKGHVFLVGTDPNTNREVLRTVLAPGGAVTTTVLSAQVGPAGIAYDGNTLFVSGWNEIDQVDLATGTVSALAGSQQAGFLDGIGANAYFNSPGGLALDPTGHFLYVADSYNHVIREIDIRTAAVSTISGIPGRSGSTDGCSLALYQKPTDLIADSSGDLYISDDQTIRRLMLSSRVVTTIAGLPGVTGTADGIGQNARFTDPRQLAVDDHGIVFVSDGWSSTIRRLDPSTSEVTTIVGTPGVSGVLAGPLPAGLNSPWGLVALPGGGLIVSDEAESSLLWVH